MSASFSASRPDIRSRQIVSPVREVSSVPGPGEKDRDALPVAEAADRLGVSETRMKELFAEGRITPLTVAGRTMVPYSELARVLSDVI